MAKREWRIKQALDEGRILVLGAEVLRFHGFLTLMLGLALLPFALPLGIDLRRALREARGADLAAVTRRAT